MCKLCFSICVSSTPPPFVCFYPILVCLLLFAIILFYFITIDQIHACFLLKDRKCMDMVGRDVGGGGILEELEEGKL